MNSGRSLRGSRGDARDHPEHGALDGEQADDQAEDQQRLFEQQAEIHAHAHGDEKQAQQQALERLDRGLDFVAVLRIGQQHAGEEGAERHGQARALEAPGDAQHQQQREGGEDLALARARDVAEHRPREEVAAHQRGGDHRDREGQPGP